MASKKDGQLSGTDLIHGDSGVPYFKGAGGAVAPSISVSTSESSQFLAFLLPPKVPPWVGYAY